MKSALRLAIAASASLTSLALGACGREAPTPRASTAAAPPTTVRTDSGVSATDGVLVLPAVKGRPGAAYFMMSNTGRKPATLSSVSIEGAGKAEMHETRGGRMAPLPSVEVPPRQMVMFERGGRHVMAFDLAPTIKAGDIVKMTMAFGDGGKLVLPLRVESAGGTTDHEAAH